MRQAQQAVLAGQVLQALVEVELDGFRPPGAGQPQLENSPASMMRIRPPRKNSLGNCRPVADIEQQPGGKQQAGSRPARAAAIAQRRESGGEPGPREGGIDPQRVGRIHQDRARRRSAAGRRFRRARQPVARWSRSAGRGPGRAGRTGGWPGCSGRDCPQVATHFSSPAGWRAHGWAPSGQRCRAGLSRSRIIAGRRRQASRLQPLLPPVPAPQRVAARHVDDLQGQADGRFAIDADLVAPFLDGAGQGVADALLPAPRPVPPGVACVRAIEQRFRCAVAPAWRTEAADAVGRPSSDSAIASARLLASGVSVWLAKGRTVQLAWRSGTGGGRGRGSSRRWQGAIPAINRAAQATEGGGRRGSWGWFPVWLKWNGIQ